MISILLATALALPPDESKGRESDALSLVTLMESLQSEVKDFRCEYEGTVEFKNETVKKARKLKADGLDDTFSGVFIWKSGGDTYVNALHRHEPEGTINREQMVITKGKAEHYLRQNDSPLGSAAITDPLFVNPDRSGSLGEIFLIDTMKRLMSMNDMAATVADEESEGRKLKVLTFTQKSSGWLFQRFWIDLRRGGHSVRRETYSANDALVGRATIDLARFQIDGSEVWMPVSGEIEGHASIKDGKPYFPKEPTMIEKIYINSGTLEFNKRPPPSTFSINYKPGTPITDNLRRVQTEFGRQQVGRRVSKPETESMLRDQLAQAENQKKELVAGSPERNGPGWTSWLVWIFGSCALISSFALLILRRR